MNRTLVMAVLPLAGLLLSGCSGGSTLTIRGEGYSQWNQQESMRCDGDGTVTYTQLGQGYLSVAIFAADERIFSGALIEQGEQGSVHDVEGPSGVWYLDVRTTGFDYSGSYAVTLRC